MEEMSMNDFENKIKGVLKKEVEKPLSYDYAIKNAFYNSKNKRKSNLLLKLATTTILFNYDMYWSALQQAI